MSNVSDVWLITPLPPVDHDSVLRNVWLSGQQTWKEESQIRLETQLELLEKLNHISFAAALKLHWLQPLPYEDYTRKAV